MHFSAIRCLAEGVGYRMAVPHSFLRCSIHPCKHGCICASRSPNPGGFSPDLVQQSLPPTEAGCKLWRKGWDSNPRYHCWHDGFQDRFHRPLGHPSASDPAPIARFAYSAKASMCGYGLPSKISNLQFKILIELHSATGVIISV